MASNGLQSGYEDAPAFPESDALAAGADLEEVARYAMRRGNAFKGTTTARNQWVTDGYAREGHLWYDTTLDQFYVYSSGWVYLWTTEETGTFTFGGLYTNPTNYDNVTLTRRGKAVRLRGGVTTNATATFAANTSYTLGTVPAGWRPASGTQPFRPIAISGPPGVVAGWVQMTTAGELQFAMAGGAAGVPTGGLLMGFDIEWLIP